jgi:molecular chaperone GrpE
MSGAFSESPTPETETHKGSPPESRPETEAAAGTEPKPDRPGGGPAAGTNPTPGSGPATKGTPEPDAEAEAENGELVDAEGNVAAGSAGDDAASSFALSDLSGLEALLSDDFARISAERDQYFDSLQRLKADFDNFRKRTDRQQAELRDRANETLLTRLLPVLDALDLALAHLGLGDATPADEASASLVQVSMLLRDTLQREGLERIDSVGVPFDPTIHDATAMDDGAPAGGGSTEDGGTVSDDNAPTGPTVAEVWRAGYRLNDRVIRPAMVRVRG